MSASRTPTILGDYDEASDSSRSELPTLPPDADTILATRLRDFRHATRSLVSIEAFSDVPPSESDLPDLLADLENVTDNATKKFLRNFVQFVQEIERKLLQKIVTESGVLVSTFAELQDILIDWSNQTLEMQRLRKQQDGRAATKSSMDLAVVDEVATPSANKWEPLPFQVPVMSSAKQDMSSEVEKFIHGEAANMMPTAPSQHPKLQSLPQTFSSVTHQNFNCGLPPSGQQNCSAEDSKQRLQQQQKTLSQQLQAHQASVAQATTQLPLWLRPQTAQASLQKPKP